MREHEDEVEADLMLHYGVDILDVGSRRLSWRRLRNFLQRLPRGSSTARALHGEAAEWGIEEHLLAGIVDLLQAANWQRGGDSKAAKPKPIPRPGVEDATRIGRTTRAPKEVAAYLARFQPPPVEEVHE